MVTQFCPHCGQPLTVPGAPFCSYCGRPTVLRPVPPGAHPPGMVAVPLAAVPVEGPPSPLYAATAPTLAYASAAGAKPGFSKARAFWCSLAVFLVALASLISSGPLTIQFDLDTFGIAFALGVPIAYWLGLSYLAYLPIKQAWIIVLAFNVATSVVYALAVLGSVGVISKYNGYGIASPYTESGDNAFRALGFTQGWPGVLVFAAFAGLITGLIGLGFAFIYASWKTVRLPPVPGMFASRLLSAFVWTVAAYVVFAIGTGIVGPEPSATVNRAIIAIPVGWLLIASGLPWYASQRTLRLLQRSAQLLTSPMAPRE